VVVTLVVVGCTGGEERGQVNLVALCVANLGVLDDPAKSLAACGLANIGRNLTLLADDLDELVRVHAVLLCALNQEVDELLLRYLDALGV